MQRSWLVWVTSTAAFVLVMIVFAIASTPQKAAQGNQAEARRKARLNYSLGAMSATNRARAAGSQAGGEAGSRFGFEDTGLLGQAAPNYQPPERLTLAHPSNYGERITVDANGNPTTNDNIVVLHETVGSASSALNLFRTNHPNDNDQVSYHTLIGLDGTIYYVVPPEQRAFGAGNSSFKTATGEESVFTNPEFPSSVNNFAYHVSLETPPDGENNNVGHSGYTEAQYQSLAWLLARSSVPNSRITTHKDVDRSGSRADPRSFDFDRLFRILNQYPSRAGLQ